MTLKRRRTKDCVREWGFSSTPFNEKTSPDTVWAGTEEHLDYLKYVLDDIMDEQNVGALLLRGDIGSGKSYHMRRLCSHVNRIEKGYGVLFKFSLKAKERGFQDILADFVKEIGAKKIKSIGASLMKEKGISEPNKRTQLLNALEEYGIERDLRIALTNLILNNLYVDTWSWVKGRLTDTQARKLGFIGNPRDETTTLETISGLIDFLAIEYDLVAIFIDELENLRGYARPAMSIREGFRDFYDTLVENVRQCGVAIFFAATAVAWADLTGTFHGALRDRLDEEIALIPLQPTEGARFILDLFVHFRKDKKDTVCPPFENTEAFDRFVEISTKERKKLDSKKMGVTGTPRRIIKNGKALFRRSCLKGVDVITVEDIDRILL